MKVLKRLTVIPWNKLYFLLPFLYVCTTFILILATYTIDSLGTCTPDTGGFFPFCIPLGVFLILIISAPGDYLLSLILPASNNLGPDRILGMLIHLLANILVYVSVGYVLESVVRKIAKQITLYNKK